MAAKKYPLSDARHHLLLDVNQSLGRKGWNVVLGKNCGAPTGNRAGVLVAKEIALKDELEDFGAQLVTDVAIKIAGNSGDRTVTAKLLVQAIIREGSKSLAAGANPMAVQRGIDRAVLVIMEELKKLSEPIADSEAMTQGSAILANPIESIIRIIAAAVGKERSSLPNGENA